MILRMLWAHMKVAANEATAYLQVLSTAIREFFISFNVFIYHFFSRSGFTMWRNTTDEIKQNDALIKLFVISDQGLFNLWSVQTSNVSEQTDICVTVNSVTRKVRPPFWT
jgi:hypothetical protein